MVRKTPIKCPHCSKKTGYHQEDFMFMVITNDIKCPHCGKTVIPVNNGIEFSSDYEISNINICNINFPTTYDKSTGTLIIDYPHKLI